MTEEDRKNWIENTEPITVTIGGEKYPMYLHPKCFKSGAVGWYISQKITLSDTACQLSLCITAIGTKRTVPLEDVNKESAYQEGFRPALDIREEPKGQLPQPSANGKPRRGKERHS